MSDYLELTNPQVEHALDELKTMIRQRYPQAQFRVNRGQDDPAAIHLTAIVDVEDTEEVVDLVIDREMELQIDDGLPIFVIPVQPIERLKTRWDARLKKRIAPVPTP
jgi:hypothetical protein